MTSYSRLNDISLEIHSNEKNFAFSSIIHTSKCTHSHASMQRGKSISTGSELNPEIFDYRTCDRSLDVSIRLIDSCGSLSETSNNKHFWMLWTCGSVESKIKYISRKIKTTQRKVCNFLEFIKTNSQQRLGIVKFIY